MKVKVIHNITFILIGIAAGVIAFFCLWRFQIAPKAREAQTNSEKQNAFDLEIDKLAIDVPVIANVDGANKKIYEDALQEGVAHYKGTALPDESGNIFIFGHSSGNNPGPYSAVFASLDDLAKNDKIQLEYKKRLYNYIVSEKKIVAANDLSVLDIGSTDKLTLMTCWPVGTKDRRLIVTAIPQ